MEIVFFLLVFLISKAHVIPFCLRYLFIYLPNAVQFRLWFLDLCFHLIWVLSLFSKHFYLWLFSLCHKKGKRGKTPECAVMSTVDLKSYFEMWTLDTAAWIFLKWVQGLPCPSLYSGLWHSPGTLRGSRSSPQKLLI